MMKLDRRAFALATTLMLAACAGTTSPADKAGKQARIDSDASAALAQLRSENPVANNLAERAKGILIMPSVLKGGLGISGESGDGVLRAGNSVRGYYNLTSAGIGLAIGVQNYSQVLMFMTDEALAGFEAGQGWEAGVDGSVAVIEQGVSAEIDTSNIQDPIVGFVFGESGLMANVSIEGSKYTRLD